MKQSLYIGAGPAFYKIVITSAVLHVLFIIFVTVPVRTKEKEYKNYFVNLVGPAGNSEALKSRPRKRDCSAKDHNRKEYSQRQGSPQNQAAVRKDGRSQKRCFPGA